MRIFPIREWHRSLCGQESPAVAGMFHANENVSGTSVCNPTAAAGAGVGFTFIFLRNVVRGCRVPALISGAPREAVISCVGKCSESGQMLTGSKKS